MTSKVEELRFLLRQLSDAAHHFGGTKAGLEEAAAAVHSRLLVAEQEAAADPPSDDTPTLTEPAPAAMSVGADMITVERYRQMTAEGWTAEHDDEHDRGQLLRATKAYLDEVFSGTGLRHWPWDRSHWKPSTDPIRNLVKAGALIAAEIDRLTRKHDAPTPTDAGSKCPRCGSYSPELHPAVQFEGEVQLCPHPFHQQVTNTNTPARIERLLARLPDYYPVPDTDDSVIEKGT